MNHKSLLITERWILLLAVCLGLGMPSRLGAQVSELVAVDDAGGTQAAALGGITSMELHGNGLYWTVYGGSCSGEFTLHSSLATLGVRSSPFGNEHYSVLGCNFGAVGGAVRDDANVYFTTPQGVMRKPIPAAAGDPAQLVGLAWGNLTPGAMMTYNGRAYYSYSSSSGQISGHGYFGIEYFDLPGARGLFEPMTDVSNGSGLPNVGRIKKMQVIQRRASDGSYNLAPYGLALTEGGYLLRFYVEQSIPLFRPAVIIATGVTDFAVRREEYFAGDLIRPGDDL